MILLKTYEDITEKEKLRLIQALTIDELKHLISFKDNDEKWKKEFMRLWQKYKDETFIKSYEGNDEE